MKKDKNVIIMGLGVDDPGVFLVQQKILKGVPKIEFLIYQPQKTHSLVLL